MELNLDLDCLYRDLRLLLSNKEWREANELTSRIMLKCVGEKYTGTGEYAQVCPYDIENFSCVDLLKINDLWVNQSNGALGFSVQQEIWEELYQNLPILDPYDTDFLIENDCCSLEVIFSDIVQWRNQKEWKRYDDFNWISPESIRGHLPTCHKITRLNAYSCGREEYSFVLIGVSKMIYSRLQFCQMN